MELSTSTQHSGGIGPAKIPALLGATKGHLTAAQIAALASGGSGSGGSVFRTPSNSGFTVATDNSGDNTAAINGFLSLLASSGDPGFLPPGDYRTTGSVVAPAGPLNLRGVFGRSTIRPAANTYHGLRIASGGGAGLGGSIIPRVLLDGIAVRGPSATPPQNGFAGIVFDGTTQFFATNLLVEGFDIGYDQINNCYNGFYTNIYTSRNVGTVNCAMNIRTDFQNGCDINYFNTQLTGRITSVCMSGTGGGYRFYGGSWGTTDTGVDDNHGVITLGRDYATQSAASGLGSIVFDGLHMEGIRGRHFVRCFGDVGFKVQNSGINPSASGGNIAAGIYKHTDMRNSVFEFDNNGLGPGQLAGPAATFQGQFDSAHGVEWGWSSNACTVNGVARSGMWLQSLALEGGLGRGISAYNHVGTGRTVLVIGGTRLRPTGTGTVETSTNGTTWSTL